MQIHLPHQSLLPEGPPHYLQPLEPLFSTLLSPVRHLPLLQTPYPYDSFSRRTKNPKSEYRNSKQFQNPNFPNFKLFVLVIWVSKICACFGFGASNLEFPPLGRPYMFHPPETSTIAPVIKLASSDTKKATTLATSSGWPIRLRGVSSIIMF